MTNEEYIDDIYSKAGEILGDQITDWTDWRKWVSTVDKLDDDLQLVYLIGILGTQVVNGGFVQYFDNSYGIFSYETLAWLRKIEAKSAANILDRALLIVNVENLQGEEFKEYIYSNVINETLGDQLDNLDTEYYELEEKENIWDLVINQIRPERN